MPGFPRACHILLFIVLAVNNKLTINNLLNTLVCQPLDYTTILQQNAKLCIYTVKGYCYEYCHF